MSRQTRQNLIHTVYNLDLMDLSVAGKVLEGRSSEH